MSEQLVAFGGNLKALGDGKIGGYLVVFTSSQEPDLHGDYFSKDTDFGLDEPRKVGVYYQHGFDPVLKGRRLGYAELKTDDAGVWMEAQLALRDDYERRIYQMIEAGKMGLSSGAVGHLVEYEKTRHSTKIKKWDIGEASITPTPAEPKTSVMPLKCLFPDEDQPEPEAESDAPEGATPAAKGVVIVTDNRVHKDMDMENEQIDALKTSNDALKAQMDAVSTQMQQVLQLMQDSPAIKGAGYFSQDGGAADKHVKSLGDWLVSVMRGDEKRLATVYDSVKATLEAGTGALGGYSVPYEYGTEIMQFATEASPVLSRVRRITVQTPAGEYPALDQFFVPTAGSGETAMAGRAKTAKRQEGGAYAETNPELEVIKYRIADVASGSVKVTRELRMDSAVSIEAFLRNLISLAVAAKMEYYVFQGSGVGEPLGILNAGARVNVAAGTSGTLAFADAVKMNVRLKSINAGNAAWYGHPTALEKVMLMANGNNNVYIPNLSGAPGGTLLGRPLFESEHLKQAVAAACLVLADLSAYTLFEMGGLYIDFSEHAAFLEGKDTWRFGMRCDGQPMIKGKITLADPDNASTPFERSPFVVFNN